MRIHADPDPQPWCYLVGEGILILLRSCSGPTWLMRNIDPSEELFWSYLVDKGILILLRSYSSPTWLMREY